MKVKTKTIKVKGKLSTKTLDKLQSLGYLVILK